MRKAATSRSGSPLPSCSSPPAPLPTASAAATAHSTSTIPTNQTRRCRMVPPRNARLIEGRYGFFVAVSTRAPEGGEAIEGVSLVYDRREWVQLLREGERDVCDGVKGRIAGQRARASGCARTRERVVACRDCSVGARAFCGEGCGGAGEGWCRRRRGPTER